MRNFLFMLLGVGLALTASAQQAAPAPPRIQPAPPPLVSAATSLDSYTRADTARAIRKLYRARRGGGTGWLAFGTAGILGATLPALQSTSAGVWTPGVVAGSAFMLIGLNKRLQFQPRRERQVLRELAATGHVPPAVARRLRGRFSPQHGAATDYNPLLARGIAPPDSLTRRTPAQVQAAARADTARAIVRLFQRRRKGGRVWAYVGASGALALVRILVSPADNGNSVSGAGVAAVAGINVGIPLIVSVANLTAYNEVRQAQVVQAYEAGQPLPRQLRQRLKRKDLEPLD